MSYEELASQVVAMSDAIKSLKDENKAIKTENRLLRQKVDCANGAWADMEKDVQGVLSKIQGRLASKQ